MIRRFAAHRPAVGAVAGLLLAAGMTALVAGCRNAPATPQVRASSPPRLDVVLLIDASTPVGRQPADREEEQRNTEAAIRSALDELRTHGDAVRTRVFLFADREVEVPREAFRDLLVRTPAGSPGGDAPDLPLKLVDRLVDALREEPAGPLAELVKRLNRQRTDILGVLQHRLRQTRGGLDQPTTGVERWPAILVVSNGIHDPDGTKVGCQVFLSNSTDQALVASSIGSRPPHVVLFEIPCRSSGRVPIYGLHDHLWLGFHTRGLIDVVQTLAPPGAPAPSPAARAYRALKPDVLLHTVPTKTLGNQSLEWEVEVDATEKGDLQLCHLRTRLASVGRRLDAPGLGYHERDIGDDEIEIKPIRPLGGERCGTTRVPQGRSRHPVTFNVRLKQPPVGMAFGVVQLDVKFDPVSRPSRTIYPKELRLEFSYEPPPAAAVWTVELVTGTPPLWFGLLAVVLWWLLGLCYRRFGLLPYGWQLTVADIGHPDNRHPVPSSLMRGFTVRPKDLDPLTFRAGEGFRCWPLDRNECRFGRIRSGNIVQVRSLGNPHLPLRSLPRMRKGTCDSGLEFLDAESIKIGTALKVEWKETPGAWGRLCRTLVAQEGGLRVVRSWLGFALITALAGSFGVIVWYRWSQYYWPGWDFLNGVAIASNFFFVMWVAAWLVSRLNTPERLTHGAHILREFFEMIRRMLGFS